MSITVAHSCSINDDGVIQQRTIAVPGGAHLLKEVSEQRYFEGIDSGELGKTGRISLMVRDGVMRVRNPGFGKSLPSEFVAGHEGDDSRQVGLVGQYEQIVHELDVLGVDRWNSGGMFHCRQLARVLICSVLNTALHVANSLEILAQLGTVGWAK